jgi:Flp pilus assembly protein TadD
MAALALILALSSPGAAAAQAAREQARTLFLEGNKLHDAGDFAGALEKFREARRLFPSYKIDLNIANTLD